MGQCNSKSAPQSVVCLASSSSTRKKFEEPLANVTHSRVDSEDFATAATITTNSNGSTAAAASVEGIHVARKSTTSTTNSHTMIRRMLNSGGSSSSTSTSTPITAKTATLSESLGSGDSGDVSNEYGAGVDISPYCAELSMEQFLADLPAIPDQLDTNRLSNVDASESESMMEFSYIEDDETILSYTYSLSQDCGIVESRDDADDFIADISKEILLTAMTEEEDLKDDVSLPMCEGDDESETDAFSDGETATEEILVEDKPKAELEILGDSAIENGSNNAECNNDAAFVKEISVNLNKPHDGKEAGEYDFCVEDDGSEVGPELRILGYELEEL